MSSVSLGERNLNIEPARYVSVETIGASPPFHGGGRRANSRQPSGDRCLQKWKEQAAEGILFPAQLAPPNRSLDYSGIHPPAIAVDD